MTAEGRPTPHGVGVLLDRTAFRVQGSPKQPLVKDNYWLCSVGDHSRGSRCL